MILGAGSQHYEFKTSNCEMRHEGAIVGIPSPTPPKTS